MAEQYVGIDRHRRRSVIVGMSAGGEVLETVRGGNDRWRCRWSWPRPALTPRWCWRRPAAGTGPPTCCRRAAPGCTWPTRWGQDVRLPAGGDRRPRADQARRAAAHCCALLRMRRLPAAWLAPPAVRELRELVRDRAELVALRSGLKAQVHAVVAKVGQAGVRVPMSDLFGVAGSRLLEELREELRLERADALRVTSLRVTSLRVTSLRGRWPSLAVDDQEIAMLGREIATALAGDVGYLAIQAIAGVGSVLAAVLAVLVAEIGDVHRFAGAPQRCCGAGLTPRHRESDTTVRRGPITNPITNQGPRLVRLAAVEAVQRLPGASKQAQAGRRRPPHRRPARQRDRPRRRRPQAADPGLPRPA